MFERTDFSVDGGEEPADHAGPAGPAPVIVIEYRQRGLAAKLMPPALILLAAIAISAYQRSTPVFPLVPRSRAVPAETSPAAASSEIVVKAANRARLAEEASRSAVAPKAEERKQPDREPGVARSPAPGSERLVASRRPSPFGLDTVEGLVPLDPGEVVGPVERPPAAAPAGARAAGGSEVTADTAGGDAPEASKEEILQDIERESREKAGQRRDLTTLKNQARALAVADTLAKAEARRTSFHDDLRKAIKDLGKNAGPEIEKLCARHGRDTLKDVWATYRHALRLAPRAYTSRWKVEMMRSVGLPETLILDDLAHGFHKQLNSRGGPRDQNEVRVRAARELLSVPVAATRKPSAPAASTRPASIPPDGRAPRPVAAANLPRRPGQRPPQLDPPARTR